MVGTASVGFDSIIAQIVSNEENRTIARAEQTKVVGQGQQGLWWEFTFTPLRIVEQLIHIEFDTDPETWIIRAGHPQDKTYSGNVVGMSLYMAIGTTVIDDVNGTSLTATAIAIGF